ncbi:hypothetical protein CEXT_522281 [Caerostris extrusa]|uniref:Uncharacterized protein n=1 Tax=Caerostris extrusa TaxID=172846 RepID=A0AAV4M672_CAEEX|nr:hypothetical protein CEXT_522281 [Caerostris extrusa]
MIVIQRTTVSKHINELQLVRYSEDDGTGCRMQKVLLDKHLNTTCLIRVVWWVACWVANPKVFCTKLDKQYQNGFVNIRDGHAKVEG